MQSAFGYKVKYNRSKFNKILPLFIKVYLEVTASRKIEKVQKSNFSSTSGVFLA